MATSTAGTADLVAAFTGGGAIEGDAYARMANRILEAQNKQASIDQKVLEANLLRDQMRSRGNFERNSMDLPDMVRFAIMGDMADQLKYGQEAIGQSQKNKGMADIQKMAQDAAEAGKDPADVVNMIVSAIAGKHLAPTNVRVRDQATADIARTAADTAAAGALASERGAGAAYDLARAAGEGGANDPLQGLKPSGIDQQIMDALYVTEEVPNPDYDADAWTKWGRGDPTISQDIDLLPEFLAWQAEKSQNDARYLNADFALSQFMLERKTTGAPVPGKEGPGKNRRGVYDPATNTINWQEAR